MPTPPHRIAHVLRWSTVAGTEIATLRLMHHLTDFEHLAFTAVDPSPASVLFRGAGIPVIPYQPTELSMRRPLPFLRGSIRLARAFRRSGASMVHCSDIVALLDAGLAARLARLPLVCHVRNPHERFGPRERLLLRAVDRFVFVSHDTRMQFGYPVAPSRGCIVYDGIDLHAIDAYAARQALHAEFSIPSGAKVIGMVARVTAQKDHATLVRAATRIVPENQNVRFLIIGDHSGDDTQRREHAALLQQIAAAGLGTHFIFTGFRRDTERLLRGLDIFVLCTHFEGFPLVILEAMAQAAPVIATAVGGIPEIVGHEETGLLHEHQNDVQLARHILRLLSDQALAVRLGRAGRRLVKSRFTTGQFAVDIAAVYGQLLHGHPAVPASR